MKKLGLLVASLLVAVLMCGCAMAESDLDKAIAEHVPTDMVPHIYAATIYNDGVTASMDDGFVRHYKNGQVIDETRHATTSNDFFLRVPDTYQDCDYRICGMISNELFALGVGWMDSLLKNVVDYDFNSDRWFAYGLSEYELFYWSPNVDFYITSGVTDVLTIDGITFFDRADGAYVLNISPYYFGTKTREYCNYHPPTIIRLGEYSMYDYIYEMDGMTVDFPAGDVYTAEKAFESTADFREKYNIDFSTWGVAKSNFAIGDFTDPKYYEDIDVVIGAFDAPSADVYGCVTFDHITFDGHDGYLRFFLEDRTGINCISWTSYTYSEELFEQIKELLSALGPYVRTNYLDRGQIEVGYNIDGRVVYAGIQDNGEDEQFTYIFAFYDERNVE